MMTQTAIDKFTAEARFRCIVNSLTASTTITAGTIAIGTPVIFETATASLPTPNTGVTLPGTNINNFVNKPATATSIVNNLFAGIVAAAPRSDYLEREAVGLAQVYGPYKGAVVKRPTSNIGGVGAILIPDSDGSMLPAVAPMTFASIASTDTLAGTSVIGMTGLAIAMQAIASSSATETTTGTIFLRCG